MATETSPGVFLLTPEEGSAELLHQSFSGNIANKKIFS